MRLKIALICLSMLPLTWIRPRAADTLPSELSDASYWKIVTEFSEPDGHYREPVLTSNELQFQHVLPQLTKSIKAGGVYLGVGPEQNFTYIAGLRPKIAFIVDIRRDMMLEHLMYKAIFETTADRAEFVGKLFSRKRPAELTAESSVEAIFKAYAAAAPDPALAEERLEDILNRLTGRHRFELSDDDKKRIRSMFLTFMREGVVTFSSSQESPGYTRLMTATDGNGRNWSFLASQENYDRVRAMHAKNLIVPLVGDFAGPKALRMTGQYLRDHGAIVNVFYVSNVEDYLPRESAWARYASNIASLPVESSSLFIRWTIFSIPTGPPWLASIEDFVGMGKTR